MILDSKLSSIQVKLDFRCLDIKYIKGRGCIQTKILVMMKPSWSFRAYLDGGDGEELNIGGGGMTPISVTAMERSGRSGIRYPKEVPSP